MINSVWRKQYKKTFATCNSSYFFTETMTIMFKQCSTSEKFRFSWKQGNPIFISKPVNNFKNIRHLACIQYHKYLSSIFILFKANKPFFIISFHAITRYFNYCSIPIHSAQVSRNRFSGAVSQKVLDGIIWNQRVCLLYIFLRQILPWPQCVCLPLTVGIVTETFQNTCMSQ